MSSQQEADIDVLQALYFRSISDEPSTRLARLKNRMQIGGMEEQQFQRATDTLRSFRMIELGGDGDDGQLSVSITAHGNRWLMSNFHWVQDDRLRLHPNDIGWTMDQPSSPIGNVIAAEKN